MARKNKGKFGKAKSAVEESDEFVSGMHRLGAQLRPHAVKIGVAIGVVMALLIALFTYQWWNRRQAKQATALYTEAVVLSQRQVVPPLPDPAGEDGQDDPEAAAEKATKEADPSKPKTFDSEVQRAEAVLIPLDKLARDYGSTGVAKEARLLHASTLMKLGRYEQALPLFRAYAGSSANASLRAIAREGVGYALEAKAMALEDASAREAALGEALEAFRQIQPNEDGPRRDYALYHEARLLEALNRDKEALDAFRKALEVNKEGPLTYDINQRIALLQSAAAE